MTRGREANRLHLVAENLTDARAQFTEAMERDRADRGLDHATRAAQEAVRGLIADGPVRLVTDELARLDHETERAERAAERWEQIAARLDAQRATHRAEDDESTTVLRQAEDTAAQIRAEVTQPLIVQAEHDGAAYLDAIENETAASARLVTIGRFGRRKARPEHRAATEHTQVVRAQMRETWGEPPRSSATLPAWAIRQAERLAEAEPRVIDAARKIEVARADRDEVRQRHEQERRALLVSEYGVEQARRAHLGMRTPNPHRQARDTNAHAAMLRAEAEELRSLPVNDAARRIEARRAEQNETRQQTARRAQQFRAPFERDSRRTDPHREGPTRRL